MTGITKDELMQMASDAGLSFLDGSARAEFDDYIDDELIEFANAILERAAEHFVNHKWMDVTTYDAAEEIRALKINTGD